MGLRALLVALHLMYYQLLLLFICLWKINSLSLFVTSECPLLETTFYIKVHCTSERRAFLIVSHSCDHDVAASNATTLWEYPLNRGGSWWSAECFDSSGWMSGYRCQTLSRGTSSGLTRFSCMIHKRRSFFHLMPGNFERQNWRHVEELQH